MFGLKLVQNISVFFMAVETAIWCSGLQRTILFHLRKTSVSVHFCLYFLFFIKTERNVYKRFYSVFF